MFPFMESWISRNLAHQSLLRGNQRWLRMDMYCCATLPHCWTKAARKLCQLEGTRPCPALHSIIADAVIFAERILKRIDSEWPPR
jgi:hypothetical protein